MSSWQIDRGFPHQVAMPNTTTVARHRELKAATEGLKLSPLPHGFFRDGQSWVVYCFAEPEDATRIAQQFDGELMCPDTRPRWPAKPSPRERRERRAQRRPRP
jgi:hypothetical protein